MCAPGVGGVGVGGVGGYGYGHKWQRRKWPAQAESRVAGRVRDHKRDGELLRQDVHYRASPLQHAHQTGRAQPGEGAVGRRPVVGSQREGESEIWRTRRLDDQNLQATRHHTRRLLAHRTRSARDCGGELALVRQSRL